MGRRYDKTQYCPECGQHLHLLDRDKFMKCHRCGWTKGYPVLRWFVHFTWVTYYLRKIPGMMRLLSRVKSLILTIVRISIYVTIGFLFIGVLAFLGSLAEEPAPSRDVRPEGGSTVDEADRGLNEEQVEDRFIELLNEERRERGLQTVSERDVLTEMGENHSRDMAKKGYFAHTEPDGDTITDRFRKHGLLPECKLPIRGSNRHYLGTENIAYTYFGREVDPSWRSGTVYVSDEEDLAKNLFQIWMHSKPHREAMLVASADEAGLGLSVTQSGKVYSSLELC